MELTTFKDLENILLTAMETPTMSIKEVSKETGIGASCLYKWVRRENHINPQKADIILNWLKEAKPQVLEAAITIYNKGGYQNGQ